LELPVPSLRLIVLLLVASLGVSGCDRQKPEAPQAPASATAAPRKGIDRSHAGQMAPDASFSDPAGAAIGLSKFRGAPVLVNLWASWCAPCVKELPTLDALAMRNGAPRVVAISQDDGARATVDAFLASKKVGRFAAYQDKDMALMSGLGVQILPTTILFDAAGKEVWRFTGDLDWTGAAAAKLLAEAR
jgi:thiol-disulfide isomerase/thioredoxin